MKFKKLAGGKQANPSLFPLMKDLLLYFIPINQMYLGNCIVPW